MLSIQEYRPIENIGFYLLVFGALIVMATYIWQFRKMPGAKSQVYAQVSKCAWLLTLVFITIRPGLADKLFWNQLLQAACVLSPYFWFVFVVEISHQEAKLPTTVKYGLVGIVGCLLLGMMTNSWHGLFWRQAWLDGQNIKVVLGPGVWLARLTSYLLCTLAVGFSVRWILTTVGLRRRQALWFTFAAAFSLIGSVLDFVPSAQSIAPLPLNFLLNGLLLTWGFYRWHTYNILPLSQEVVVRDMIDGLVVVDEYGYIVDLNPAAKTILRDVPGQIGGRFDQLAAAWPELAAVYDGAASQTVEAIRDDAHGRCYYRLQMTPVKTREQWLGKAIVLKDITEQKKQQATLLEQQKALSILTERERLGRELHDDRAQICNFLGLELQTVHFLLGDGQFEKAITQVDRLRKMVKDLNLDIRESIIGLKKTNAANRDFATKLREYLAWYEKNREIVTELVLPAEPVDGLLSDTAKLQLLRIIQEALTNIRKHANARQAKVQLEKTDRQITVSVEDDGCGFEASAVSGKDKSFGLQIMNERAQEAGGRLEIDTKPGRGTKVMVRFCLKNRKSEVGSREDTVSG